MKVYKLEVLVIDDDNLGPEEISDIIEQTRYPNHAIVPYVMHYKEADIGEWHDENPLNYSDKKSEEYKRLFPTSDLNKP